MPMLLVDFDPAVAATDESRSLTLTLAILIMIPFLAYMILLYVLHGLGLQKMAIRRGIHHPWLAWIPVGREWLLGCLSDQYQYLSRGKNRFLRRWMAIVSVPYHILTIGAYLYFVALLPIQLSSPEFTTSLETLSEADIYAMFPAAFTGLLYLVSWAMVIVRCFALYDLFSSSYPRYKLPLLLISILVDNSVGFLVFAVRDCDKGMPPKRQSIPGTPCPPEM